MEPQYTVPRTVADFSNDFQDKTILITGTNRGLGLELTK